MVRTISSPSAPVSIRRPGFTRSAARAESSWRSLRIRRSGFHGTRMVTRPLSTSSWLSSINGLGPPPVPSLSRKTSW